MIVLPMDLFEGPFSFLWPIIAALFFPLGSLPSFKDPTKPLWFSKPHSDLHFCNNIGIPLFVCSIHFALYHEDEWRFVFTSALSYFVSGYPSSVVVLSLQPGFGIFR
jgi:hypothetical protein